MAWSKEVTRLLGRKTVMKLNLQQTKSAITAYLFLALCYPLLLLGTAYGIQWLAAEGTVTLPSLWVDAGIALGWISLIACPAIFLPRARHNARMFREITNELAKHGITIDEGKSSFRPDDAMKRIVLYSATAVGLFMVGKLIDSDVGMLLRWTGLAGIVVIGIMLVLTNDVVLVGEDNSSSDA